MGSSKPYCHAYRWETEGGTVEVAVVLTNGRALRGRARNVPASRRLTRELADTFGHRVGNLHLRRPSFAGQESSANA